MTALQAHRKGFQNITLKDVRNGHAQHPTKGYAKCKITLTTEEIDKLVDIIGGQHKTKLAVHWALLNSLQQSKSFGLLERFMFDVTDYYPNGYWSYCAGQDMRYEMKIVRDLLK